MAALEDAEDYQAFEAAVIADYDAQSAVERELVLRLASILWRLRRATGIETSLFEFVRSEAGKPESAEPKLMLIASAEQGQPPAEPTQEMTARSDAQRRLGDRFLCLSSLPTFPLDRLSRYEQTLWRQARQIVVTLSRIQTRLPYRAAFTHSFRPGQK